jgi:hypothetical protein
MIATSEQISEGTTETTLPNACLVCGQDVQLRVTHGKAKSYCAHCHWVGSPVVTVGHNGLRVQYRSSGDA